MDVDTIFPAITFGEHIVGKYEYRICCGSFEILAILTNLRLLIRRSVTTCGCLRTSTHSSINLRSIDRIDESRAGFNVYFILLLTVMLIPAIFMLASGEAVFILIGVVLLLLCIGGFVLLFLSRRGRYVRLQGKFGLQFLQFSEATARDLDGRLSEMIYSRKVQQNPQQGISQQRSVPPVAATTYQTNETQPLSSHGQQPFYTLSQ